MADLYATDRPSKQITESSTFRADVEGLRAAAVLLVVAFHYGVTGISGGFIGVDIFFVISGFVITRMLVAEVDRRGTVDFVNFYGRRARRLLPASLAMVAVTLVACAVFLSPFELQDFTRSAAASSLYVSNFWFLSRFFDYFAPEAAQNPFLHTWTLSVEEQFYLIWPAFILAISRFSRRRQMESIVALSLLSFAVCVWFVAVRQPVAFYATPFRVWEFGIGALVAYARPKRFSELFSIVGVAAIGVSSVTLHEQSPFPGFNAVPAAVGTALLLLAGVRGSSISSALKWSPFQWIGKLSYSIYLWHWPVIVLAGAIWPDLGSVTKWACLGLVLLLSWTSFTFLEQPVRVSPWLIARKWRSLAMACALTVFGVAASGLFWEVGAAQIGPRQMAIHEAAISRSILKKNCIADFTDSEANPCRFSFGGPTIALIGDSHAAQIFTPIYKFAQANRMTLVTYFKSTCPISGVTIFNPRLKRLSPECDQWRRAVFSRLANAPPEIIIIAQLSTMHVIGSGWNESEIIPPPEWAQGTYRSLKTLVSTGARVIFVEDSPTMQINVPTCLSRVFHRGGSLSMCDRPRRLALDDQLALLERSAAHSAGAAYLPTSDIFCSHSECRAEKGGQIIYRDGNHISELFAASLSNEFARRIQKLAESRAVPH